MSVVDSCLEINEPGELGLPERGQPLHRLGIVRRLQAISRRTVARELNIRVSEVRRQEAETSDLRLSQLYQWQQSLGVPLTELLIESGDELALSRARRNAQLVRIMKTVLALSERNAEEHVGLMVQSLFDELIEIMPELRDVIAWHTVGTRRASCELGSAAERMLSDAACVDPD